ncbi:dehydrogenase-like protein [Clostridium sp. CAG:1013]|nr:dehydrogenase-like protein [Clostridium sp. CAG:1013]
MKKVRVGVIGVGGLACGIHLPILSSLEEVELVALCDWDESRAEKACRQFDVPKMYVSHVSMLREEKLDAVFVLTQPDMLFRVALDCLNADLAVFMEKPMGITLFQANTLKRVADEKDRRLHVGFNRRSIPLVTAILKRMRELTDITHVEGRFYKNSSASFYDGCASAFVCDVIHVIDLVRHIASSPVEKCMTLQGPLEKEGVVQSWYSAIAFENGMTGVVRANYQTGGRVHDFEIHGPNASAYIDLGFGIAGCSGRILHCNGQTHSISAAGNAQPEIEYFDGVEIAESEEYARYYGYFDEDLDFIRRVQNDPVHGDPQRTAEDYATMELVQQLQSSCQ